MHDDHSDNQESLIRAIEELQFTINKASACDVSDRTCADEILSHCQDLAEDIDAIQFDPHTTRKVKLDAEAVIKEGRRLRRTLNKKAILLKEQNKQLPPNKIPGSTPSVSAPSASKKSTLQKIQVPKFNGDYKKFRPFYDTFHEEVENNATLTDAAKWIYLRDSLEGKAAELVLHLPQIPETRSVALDLLNSHYGGKNKSIADLYRQLQTTAPAQMTDEQLRFTQARIEGILLTLENLGHSVNDNAFVRTIVLDKFPHEFKCSFITDEDMSLADIRRMIHQRIKARESIASFSINPNKLTNRTQPNKTGQKQNRNFAERPITCLFCNGLHWSDECQVFKTAEARLKQIPDRCPRCLRTKHDGNCTTEKRCVYCDLTSHNRAVCPKKFPSTVSLAIIEKPSKQTVADSGVYLTLCIPVTTPSNTEHITVCAVIDTGGAKNIITQNLANALRIKPDPTSQIEFLTLNGVELPPARRAITPLHLQTYNKSNISIPTYITSTIATDLPTADLEQFRTNYPQYDNLHIPPSGNGQPVNLLLGKDSLSKIFTLASSVEVSPDLQLLSTRFGWIILGTQSLAVQQSNQSQLSFHEPAENSVKLMWDLDVIGLAYILDKESALEEIAIRKFYESITFDNGRYYVGWPWKDYPPTLNENYGLALGRLKSLHNKLIKTPSLLKQYHEIISLQETNEIIEKVETPDTTTTATIKHYISHHPVIRPDADSTKLRLVYDASARLTQKDKSLNDNLLKGSVWVSDLISMLIRFRRYRTALVADIKQAFLQIGIQPADRDAVRFLWLKNPDETPKASNLQIYRFTRVAFGIISSPFLLYATIRYHIQPHKSYAADVLRSDLYADNLVTSLRPDIDPLTFYDEIQTLFNTMSMDMTKWASNIPKLREYIPSTKQQPNRLQTVLGLEWDTLCDTLRLKKVDFTIDEHIPITKRRALRLTAKVFDPLGWAAPITLLAKSFIRRLWQLNTTWDQDLPTTQNEWDEILFQLKQTSRIEIIRPFLDTEYTNSNIAIHTFVDASATAYAAVSYITIINKTSTRSTILAARNRLTPQTKITIPRLELLAILIGCRLTTKLTMSLQFTQPPQAYIWSDSQCALSWLHSHKVLPAVVNKQLNEIRTYKNLIFQYVPSEQNFADAASRGATYDDLQRIDWWTGPPWLIEKQHWPLQPSPNSTPSPATILFVPVKQVDITQNHSIMPETGICTLVITNFSTLSRLLRRTAFCIYAVNAILRRQLIRTQSKFDYNTALKLWIRWAQQTTFPNLSALNKNTSTIFRNLRITYDDDGIIRCLTRIKFADADADTKQPILLIKKHYLTQLIVLQLHTNAKHAGVAHTLALLREKYWLPHGRREIQTILRQHCYQCQKSTTSTYTVPDVAPLPEFRVTRAEYPFECTGIDIFGPFRTRPCEPHPQPVTKQKRWILLFTCTITRAVHLELITDVSTTTILDGLRRFIARRVFDSADGVTYFASKQLTWKFLPPHSPWMGGHYERLISIIKKAIFTTYGNLIMPDRQFETSLIEVEAMLNSRPLTYVDQTLDTTIITPNSFFNVKFPAINLLANVAQNRDRILSLWHASQKHLDNFWRTWSADYLLALRERDDKLKKKQNAANTSPEINDIVLIAEPEHQRCAWRLARIERSITSDDNTVRSVQLILGDNSRIVRPIIKPAPLHLKADLPAATGVISSDKTAIVLEDPAENTLTDEEDAEIIEIDLEWDDPAPAKHP